MFAPTLAAMAAALIQADAQPSAASDMFHFEVTPAALQSEAGALRTYDRLEQAARLYCSTITEINEPARARCRSQVIAHVMTSVDHPALNAAQNTRKTQRLGDI